LLFAASFKQDNCPELKLFNTTQEAKEEGGGGCYGQAEIRVKKWFGMENGKLVSKSW